ncbi:hypothetical protein BGX27_005662, partial [Mortierella sp. AM989]
ALTSGEKVSDYEWVLKWLLRVTGNTASGAVMIDKDPGMGEYHPSHKGYQLHVACREEPSGSVVAGICGKMDCIQP